MRYRRREEVTAFRLPHALTIDAAKGRRHGIVGDYLVFENTQPRIETQGEFEARYEPVRDVERSHYPHWLGGPLGNMSLTDTGLRIAGDHQIRLNGLTSGTTVHTTLQACPVSQPIGEPAEGFQTYRLKETATANAT